MKKNYAIWRPFKYFILINLIVLAVSNVYFYRSLSNFYLSQSVDELSTRAKVFNLGIGDLSLNAANLAMLNDFARKVGAVTDSRITVMDVNGKVLGDTLEAPEVMENHLLRREIALALTGVTGSDIRVSATTRQKTLYVAEPIFVNGEIAGVSRAARTIKYIDEHKAGMLWKIAAFNLLALVILAVISYVISRYYTKPLRYMEQTARDLATGAFQVRVKPSKVPEFKVLADSINSMANTIEDRVQTITHQRNNLNIVLNSITDALLVVNDNETITEINPAAATWLNIKRENALGRDLREIVRYGDMQAFILAALQSPAPLGADVTVHSAEGREYILRLKSSPLNSAGVQGCVIVFYDITQTRKMEKMRRDFVSNVSHEIRTPLAAIQVSAEALNYSGLLEGHAEQQFVASICQHSERLGNLVNDLLLLSRIEQHPEEFATESVNLKALLQRAVEGSSSKLKTGEKGIQINCPQDLMLTLNPRLMELALMNLLDNALKYNLGNANVEVFAAKEGDYARISVRDFGAGIPAEHLPHLFERFYRVDDARSRQTGGTGLGLAIVKHIALAHNGRAEVQSVLGQGSVFSLLLPCDAPAESIADSARR